MADSYDLPGGYGYSTLLTKTLKSTQNPEFIFFHQNAKIHMIHMVRFLDASSLEWLLDLHNFK